MLAGQGVGLGVSIEYIRADTTEEGRAFSKNPR